MTRGPSPSARARSGACRLQDPLDVDVVGLLGLGDRLVVDGEVEDDVLAVRVRLGLAVHPRQAGLHDVRDLVGERRVVVHDRRVGRRQQRRVAVGVLQPLTGQRGAAGRGADQEAARELVGHRPDRVAGPLEPEHRVEDVERDHVLAVGAVRRAQRRSRTPSRRPRRCPRGASGPARTPCRTAAACGRPPRSCWPPGL